MKKAIERFFLPLTAYGLLLFLTGCTTLYNPATGRKETLLPTSIEQILVGKMRMEMGLTSIRIGRVDAQQVTRVQEIGKAIAAVSDRKDVKYQFGVKEDSSINAFNVGGGVVYVHTGLLDKTDDEMLAAVLAHEVGHDAARHVVKHMQAAYGFVGLMKLAQVAGMKTQSAQLANFMFGLMMKGFGRQDELEADRLGVRYLHRSGHNPEALIRVFEMFQKEMPEGPLEKATVWNRTHPLNSDRIKQAKEEIAKLKQKAFCPACGATYAVEVKFCEKDGTALKLQEAPPAANPQGQPSKP
ncbi:MAG: M48 family metalloprotease [Candidatus Omnitrophica bacterium]|nr:M48 family metalloprotease [Candidatus Omnitrophota bacterium]